MAQTTFTAAACACVVALTSCIPAIEPVAAAGLKCEEDQLDVDGSGLRRVVSGCGKKDVYLYDMEQGVWVSLRDRVSFEMRCEKDAIEIKILDSTSFGASACDHRAVYLIENGGFVMNSALEGGGKSGGKSEPEPDRPAE